MDSFELFSPRQILRFQESKKLQEYENKQCNDVENCTTSYDEIDPTPFGLIRVTLPWNYIVHGYYHETHRMSDISKRCKHHSPRFNNDSKAFISFIIKGLYFPINTKTNKDDSTSYGPKTEPIRAVFDDMFDCLFISRNYLKLSERRAHDTSPVTPTCSPP